MITYEEIQSSEVRSLTWKQPFASLMLHEKQETRTWHAKYRGLVLITAGLGVYTSKEIEDMCGDHNTNRIIERLFDIPVKGKPFSWPFNFQGCSATPTGHSVAIGRLQTSISAKEYHTDLLKKHFEDETYVLWKSGLFIHIYSEVIPVVQIPWKGHQGWRILTPEQKQLIKLSS